jgi:hypothetical protein
MFISQRTIDRRPRERNSLDVTISLQRGMKMLSRHDGQSKLGHILQHLTLVPLLFPRCIISSFIQSLPAFEIAPTYMLFRANSKCHALPARIALAHSHHATSAGRFTDVFLECLRSIHVPYLELMGLRQ